MSHFSYIYDNIFVRNQATTMLPPTRFYFNWKVMCSRGIFFYFLLLLLLRLQTTVIFVAIFSCTSTAHHTQRSQVRYKCIRYGFKCFYITLALLLLSELDERHDTDEDSCDVCLRCTEFAIRIRVAVYENETIWWQL